MNVLLNQPDYFVSFGYLKIVATGTSYNQEKRQCWLLTKSFPAGQRPSCKTLDNSNSPHISGLTKNGDYSIIDCDNENLLDLLNCQ
jgi:hypothetical protein